MNRQPLAKIIGVITTPVLLHRRCCQCKSVSASRKSLCRIPLPLISIPSSKRLKRWPRSRRLQLRQSSLPVGKHFSGGSAPRRSLNFCSSICRRAGNLKTRLMRWAFMRSIYRLCVVAKRSLLSDTCEAFTNRCSRLTNGRIISIPPPRRTRFAIQSASTLKTGKHVTMLVTYRLR